METLFALKPVWPSGFQYQEEFISEEEEQMLINEIRKYDLHTFLFHGFEAKRKVISFGYDYNFSNRSLSQGQPIPPQFSWLINRVAKFVSENANQFAELLLTEYPKGAVINWHRDAFPFELIAGVSLLSDCTFKLRPFEKNKQRKGAIISFPVRRRSLYIIQGDARWSWEHSTAPVVSSRYSVTLRTLRT